MMILSRFFVAIALIVTLLSPLMPGLQSASAAPDDQPSPPVSADGPNAFPTKVAGTPSVGSQTVATATVRRSSRCAFRCPFSCAFSSAKGRTIERAFGRTNGGTVSGTVSGTERRALDRAEAVRRPATVGRATTDQYPRRLPGSSPGAPT